MKIYLLSYKYIKMVRTIHRVMMPMNGGTMRMSTRKHISGMGIGSVLLDGGLGGAGGGSSYTSLEDYIHTTGANPYAGEPKSLGRGLMIPPSNDQSSGGRKSLESMNKKLEALLVKSKKGNPKAEKNINFNI